MKTVHPVEDSISNLRVVEYVENPNPDTKINSFYLDCTVGEKELTLAFIRNAGGMKIFGIDETDVILSDPCEVRGASANIVRDNPEVRLHSLFFAVRDRPPYVPQVTYMPKLPASGEVQNPKPDACIRISVYEEPDREPIVEAAIFIPKPGKKKDVRP